MLGFYWFLEMCQCAFPHRGSGQGSVEGTAWAAPEWSCEQSWSFLCCAGEGWAWQERWPQRQSGENRICQVEPGAPEAAFWLLPSVTSERNILETDAQKHCLCNYSYNTTPCFVHSDSCWEGHSISKHGSVPPVQISSSRQGGRAKREGPGSVQESPRYLLCLGSPDLLRGVPLGLLITPLSQERASWMRLWKPREVELLCQAHTACWWRRQLPPEYLPLPRAWDILGWSNGPLGSGGQRTKFVPWAGWAGRGTL